MMNYDALPNCFCFAIYFENGFRVDVRALWVAIDAIFADLSIVMERVGSASGKSVRADRNTIERMLTRDEINVTAGKSSAPLRSYDWRACAHFHPDLRRLFFGLEAEPETRVQSAIEIRFFEILRFHGARYGFLFNRPVGLNPVAYASGMNSIETDSADRDLRMAWSNSVAAGIEGATIRDVFEINCFRGGGAPCELASSIESVAKAKHLGSLQRLGEVMIWRVPKSQLREARGTLIEAGIIKSPQWVRERLTRRVKEIEDVQKTGAQKEI